MQENERSWAPSAQRYFVILSGAYCSPDIVAEYGLLPPTFLPAGGRRLYELQLDVAARTSAQPVLTLPADFAMDTWDAERLAARNVRIVRSPVSLNLAEAVQFVLEVLDAQGEICLLHGDTLIEDPEIPGSDCVATQETQDYYTWADVSKVDKGGITLHTSLGDGLSTREVACGFFRFQHGDALRTCLLGQNDFIAGVNAYAQRYPLLPHKVERWYDFGHLPRIFQSKQQMLISRSFNSVQSDGAAVIKASQQVEKIAAEVAWYRGVPEHMRIFTPQFLGADIGLETASFTLEYLYQENVGDLFVFGRLPAYIWRRILDGCRKFLEACHRTVPEDDVLPQGAGFPETVFRNLIVDKSRARLDQFCHAQGWRTDRRMILNGETLPPLDTVVERLLELVPPTQKHHIRLWHGDFFFGNAFYDFRANRVRVVDPRGSVPRVGQTIYGDWRYDLAKLAHSIHGRYDFLALGRASLHIRAPGDLEYGRPTTPQAESVDREFQQMSVNGLGVTALEIRALTALLFLTMLPLHADDPWRQTVLLANGLSLYRDLEREH